MNVLTQRKLLNSGVLLGWALMLSPFVGLSISAFGMLRAFHSLGSTGISDPKALSSSVAMCLYSTAIGLFLFPFGTALVIISNNLHNRLRTPMPPPLPRFHNANPGTA